MNVLVTVNTKKAYLSSTDAKKLITKKLSEVLNMDEKVIIGHIYDLIYYVLITKVGNEYYYQIKIHCSNLLGCLITYI